MISENQHFTTILAIEPGKTHHGMLKHVSESLLRNKLFRVSTNLSPQIIIN